MPASHTPVTPVRTAPAAANEPAPPRPMSTVTTDDRRSGEDDADGLEEAGYGYGV